MDKLKGRLTISRFTSNREPDYISITVADEMSGITFIKITCTVEALGYALTGLSYQDCDFDLNGIQNVGARREMKTEMVLVPVQYPRIADVIEAARHYEKDGWRHGLSSTSRIIGSNWDGQTCGIEVSFTRFVRDSEA